MEKLAPSAFAIHQLLRRRWSPLAFAGRPVEVEKMQRLLEAARWAPSSYNEQPWSFLIAAKENAAEHDRMLQCLVEGNRVWAKNAPVLMISVASLSFAKNGKPNRHAFHDVGAAMADLTLQATIEGLFVHQMAGIDVDKTRTTYGIPTTHDPVAGIALGYPGDIDALSDSLKQRELAPRSRKAIGEFVFGGKWGEKSSVV